MGITVDAQARSGVERVQDRSTVYAYLSLALLYPDEETIEALGHAQPLAEAAMSRLRIPETLETTRTMHEAFRARALSDLAALHERTFGLASGCLPYESEYDQRHVFQKSQQLADIVAFYRAFGLALAPDLKERADHISVELELMHVLAAKEAYALLEGHGADKVALCRQAQSAFLEAHLGSWVPSLATRLGEVDPTGPYGSIGRFLGAFLEAETDALALPATKPLDALEAEDELDPACETCPLVLGVGR